MEFHEFASRQPTLYEAGVGDAVTLLGWSCAECGAVTVASGQYGCASCGAEPDRLERRTLTGRGHLRAFVTVHQQLVPGRAAPYVFGSVVLDEGPVIGAILKVSEESSLRLGMAVAARGVAYRAEGEPEPKIECQFEPVSA